MSLNGVAEVTEIAEKHGLSVRAEEKYCVFGKTAEELEEQQRNAEFTKSSMVTHNSARMTTYLASVHMGLSAEEMPQANLLDALVRVTFEASLAKRDECKVTVECTNEDKKFSQDIDMQEAFEFMKLPTKWLVETYSMSKVDTAIKKLGATDIMLLYYRVVEKYFN